MLDQPEGKWKGRWNVLVTTFQCQLLPSWHPLLPPRAQYLWVLCALGLALPSLDFLVGSGGCGTQRSSPRNPWLHVNQDRQESCIGLDPRPTRMWAFCLVLVLWCMLCVHWPGLLLQAVRKPCDSWLHMINHEETLNAMSHTIGQTPIDGDTPVVQVQVNHSF